MLSTHRLTGTILGRRAVYLLETTILSPTQSTGAILPIELRCISRNPVISKRPRTYSKLTLLKTPREPCSSKGSSMLLRDQRPPRYWLLLGKYMRRKLIGFHQPKHQVRSKKPASEQKRAVSRQILLVS